jgi:hypothetical protein
MRDFWYIAPYSLEVYRRFRDAYYVISLVMEAVHTSETSVHFNVTTGRYIPED